jgi:hypothetical protein
MNFAWTRELLQLFVRSLELSNALTCVRVSIQCVTLISYTLVMPMWLLALNALTYSYSYRFLKS